MIATLIDTETSGLIDNHSVKLDRQPEIIEYYARTVDLVTGALLHEYETLIKPKKPIDAKITEITGITNEMLAGQPEFKDVAFAIAGTLCTHPVIAHNASFDCEMLDIEFERMGTGSAITVRKICTVEATLHLKGFRLGLNALHEALFGEPFKDHHRARNDVMALERICLELFKRGEL